MDFRLAVRTHSRKPTAGLHSHTLLAACSELKCAWQALERMQAAPRVCIYQGCWIVTVHVRTSKCTPRLTAACTAGPRSLKGRRVAKSKEMMSTSRDMHACMHGWTAAAHTFYVLQIGCCPSAQGLKVCSLQVECWQPQIQQPCSETMP